MSVMPLNEFLVAKTQIPAIFIVAPPDVHNAYALMIWQATVTIEQCDEYDRIVSTDILNFIAHGISADGSAYNIQEIIGSLIHAEVKKMEAMHIPIYTYLQVDHEGLHFEFSPAVLKAIHMTVNEYFDFDS